MSSAGFSAVNGGTVLNSKIRLVRNFSDYSFPNRMSDEEREGLRKRFESFLPELKKRYGLSFNKIALSGLSLNEKLAFSERVLINKASFEEKKPVMLYVTDDERISVTLNGQDHVRILVSGEGKCLKESSVIADRIDDSVNEFINYAFSKNYGFLTSGLSNLGTGMRGYFVLHLPLLSSNAGFAALSQEITKYGVNLKEAWSRPDLKVSGLYLIYNQRTLGVSESDIIELLQNVCDRLEEEELRLRKTADSFRLRDIVMKSYGLLSHSLILTEREACIHISNLILGVSLGFLECAPDINVYDLVHSICPGNLSVFYSDDYSNGFSDDRLCELRADYLRNILKSIRVL